MEIRCLFKTYLGFSIARHNIPHLNTLPSEVEAPKTLLKMDGTICFTILGRDQLRHQPKTTDRILTLGS